MATANKTYIGDELDWYEDRLREIKADIDSTPYTQVVDRIVRLDNSKGFSETIAEKKENIKKAIRDSLKEYISLAEIADRLREQDENKQLTARGGAKTNRQMEALVKGR